MLARAPADSDVAGTGNRRAVPPGDWRGLELDVTSPTRIQATIEREHPGAVLYTAYVTANRAVTVDGAAAAARAAARVGARFVFLSTDLVFDGEHAPYREDDPADPVLPYGIHKREAEALVRSEHDEAVILRPALMFGETSGYQRPAYECERLARGVPCDLFVDEWRSPVHVDDVARAVWELAALEVAGTWHLGGPRRLSRFELGRLLCGMHGFDSSLLWEAR